jgi:hypothetical protein
MGVNTILHAFHLQIIALIQKPIHARLEGEELYKVCGLFVIFCSTVRNSCCQRQFRRSTCCSQLLRDLDAAQDKKLKQSAEAAVAAVEPQVLYTLDISTDVI